jgi:phage baseplate assembly protein W
MATYYGYSTIDNSKKFRLVDYELVKRDVLNSLSIKQGEKLGNPSYGTNVWGLIFEPQTDSTMKDLEYEMRRTVEQDPRVKVDDLQVYPQQNGVLVELFVTVLPTTEQQRLSLFFDQETQNANLV